MIGGNAFGRVTVPRSSVLIVSDVLLYRQGLASTLACDERLHVVAAVRGDAAVAALQCLPGARGPARRGMPEQDRPDVARRRARWAARQRLVDPAGLVFIDETWDQDQHGSAPGLVAARRASCGSSANSRDCGDKARSVDPSTTVERP